VTRPPDLDDLLDDDVPGEERERLRRAHELLVAAGPPPELPPSLETVPDPKPRRTLVPQRHRYAVLGLAAAFVLAAFGVGYYVGGRHNGFTTEAVSPMHGTALAPSAHATIRLAAQDDAGNWPMRFSVRGLPTLPHDAYYELYLSRGGKPLATCGTFVVHAGTTVVRLNAPYRLREYDGWVVTRHLHGQRGDGPVLLTT
jgi:hypothetical protein